MRPSSVVQAGRSRVARTSSASRACQGVPARHVPGQLDAEGIEPRLRLGVVPGQAGQHVEQPAHRGHADVVVQHRPPDLEHRDEVVLDEHVVGHRSGVAPSRRPALEPQVAGGEHGVRCLLRRERARVDGAPGDEDVGERRQLFLPRRGQEPARRRRHEPGLAQQIDHGRGVVEFPGSPRPVIGGASAASTRPAARPRRGADAATTRGTPAPAPATRSRTPRGAVRARRPGRTSPGRRRSAARRARRARIASSRALGRRA